MNRAVPLVGIDLGGTKIEAALIAADGRFLARERVPTPQGDYAGTLDAIAGLVQRLDRELPTELAGRLPLGIGMPGSIDPATGRVRGANSTVLNGRALGADLQRRLGGRALRLANDANCLAVSEAVDGAGAGLHGPVFGVILGTGVGGGIAIGAQVWGGANGIAGEWGHNPLPWPKPEPPWNELPGPRCWCGRHGCIETFLSGPALAREFAQALPAAPAMTAEQIVALARPRPGVAHADAGDESRRAQAARETLARYHDRLARALAALINLLDPAMIVLGGGLSNVGSIYTEVPRAWAAHVFSAERIVTPLRAARHGDSSGVRGAAWLWKDDAAAAAL